MERNLCILLFFSVLLLAAARGVTAEPTPERTLDANDDVVTEDASQVDIAADAHLQRGLAHYDACEFEDAIVEFLAGFEVLPRPVFLCALAQAERLSGDCASATVYYKRFLDTKPADNQVKAAAMQLATCHIALTTGPGRAPSPDSSADSSVDSPADSPGTLDISPTSVRPQSSLWYQDWLGTGLLGTGTMSFAAGLALLFESRSAADRASAANT